MVLVSKAVPVSYRGEGAFITGFLSAGRVVYCMIATADVYKTVRHYRISLASLAIAGWIVQ